VSVYSATGCIAESSRAESGAWWWHCDAFRLRRAVQGLGASGLRTATFAAAAGSYHTELEWERRWRGEWRVANGRGRGGVQRGAAGALCRCCIDRRLLPRLVLQRVVASSDGRTSREEGFLRWRVDHAQAGEWSCRGPVRTEACAWTRVRCRKDNGFWRCGYVQQGFRGIPGRRG
jgi:hypothetical protein